jgi:hypothetical protein
MSESRSESSVATPFANDPDVLSRKAMLEWLVDRINNDLPVEPEALWHYTDAGGLKGIIESDRLWATDTRFLNDASEITHGLDLAAQALNDYDTTGLKAATGRFVQGLGNLEQQVLSRYFDRTLVVYVACFCDHGDLLSQWRAYGGTAGVGGYAIGFSPRPPMAGWPHVAPGNHGFRLRGVLYDLDKQTAICHDLIKRLIPLLDEDPEDLQKQKAFSDNLIDGLVEIATWCKHPTFSEEREWRIVYVRNEDANPLTTNHRPLHGVLVPYVELTLPTPVGPGADTGRMPISSVHCGPSPDRNLKHQGVESLVKASPLHHGVGVTDSVTPLRR